MGTRVLKPKQVALSFHHVRDGLRQGQVAAHPGTAPLDVFMSMFF